MKYSLFKIEPFFFFIWGDVNQKEKKQIVGLRFLSAHEFANCKKGNLPIHFYYIMQKDHAFFQDAILQLREYFQGKRKKFDLDFCLSSIALRQKTQKSQKLPTEFEIKVWERLQKIPYGETISYQSLAKEIGIARAARAVGNASAKNPLPIFIPCHRVILSTGELGGYTGGDNIKEQLIALEKRTATGKKLKSKKR